MGPVLTVTVLNLISGTSLFLAIGTSGIFFSILVLILLLFSSALISGSEVAYFSLSPNDVSKLREARAASAERVLSLKAHPKKLLAIILISNNFINIGIVVLSDFIIWNLMGEEVFNSWATSLREWPLLNRMSIMQLSRSLNFLLTVVGVTSLLVLFGEVAPKIYARFNNIALARNMSGVLTFLNSLLSPFSNILVRWGRFMEEKLPAGSNITSDHKDEIEEAIKLTISGATHAKRDINMLKSIINLDEQSVKQIMTSRLDVVALDIESNKKEIREVISASGFSRIPVYEEDFDHIVGILYVKDLIGRLDEENTEWQSLIRRDVLYVPETRRINELLKEFQQKRLHIAIVVDEYGGSSGLVTLENIMEEVIGEIKDEFDETELDYEKIDDFTFLFEGKMLLNDVCRVIDRDIDTFDKYKGEADSIAGLMLEVFGQIPKKKDEIMIGKYRLTVENVNERRIEKVKLTIDHH